MQITGLKVSDKVLYEQKKAELDTKLRSYVSDLKHELLLQNGFTFNLKKAAYINKKLRLEYSPEIVREIKFNYLMQAIKNRKRGLV